jgi:hypothetical protein
LDYFQSAIVELGIARPKLIMMSALVLTIVLLVALLPSIITLFQRGGERWLRVFNCPPQKANAPLKCHSEKRRRPTKNLLIMNLADPSLHSR